VLQNPNPATRSYAPYAVVLQSHHLEPLDTVLPAPLVNDAKRSVNPVDLAIEFGGQALVLILAEVAGVPKQGLGRAVGSVIDREDEIRRALDRLFTGF